MKFNFGKERNFYGLESTKPADDGVILPSPYTLADVRYDPDGTRIEIRNVIIDDANISSFRMGRTSLITGFCETNGRNNIIIYRYNLGRSMRLDSRFAFDVVLMKHLMVKDAELRAIAHEKRHINNLKFGNREEIFRNFDEMVFSFVWDEVSAFTAEEVYNIKQPTEKTLSKALAVGVREFITNSTEYIRLHTDIVFDVARKRDEDGDIELGDFEMKGMEKSALFDRLMTSYLTFGGVSCWTRANIKKHSMEISLLEHLYRKELSQLKEYLRTGIRQR